MATQDQIEQWKREYGNVFSVSVRGVDYIFREITFHEYDQIFVAYSNVAEAEEYIVSIALLHPDNIDFDNVPAGIVTSLAEEILEISGFGSPKRARDILDSNREQAAEVRGLMKAFVLAAFSAYKEEEFDDLTFNELAYKVALAEKAIEINQAAFGVENNEVRLDIIDPEEEREKDSQRAYKHAAQKKPGQAGYDDPIARKLHNALQQ